MALSATLVDSLQLFDRLESFSSAASASSSREHCNGHLLSCFPLQLVAVFLGDFIGTLMCHEEADIFDLSPPALQWPKSRCALSLNVRRGTESPGIHGDCKQLAKSSL